MFSEPFPATEDETHILVGGMGVLRCHGMCTKFRKNSVIFLEANWGED
jgi:hypothetical protein